MTQNYLEYDAMKHLGSENRTDTTSFLRNTATLTVLEKMLEMGKPRPSVIQNYLKVEHTTIKKAQNLTCHGNVQTLYIF